MYLGGGGAEELDIPRPNGLFVALQRGFGVGVVFEHDECVAGGATVAHAHEQHAIFTIQYLRRRVALREKLVLDEQAIDRKWIPTAPRGRGGEEDGNEGTNEEREKTG